MINSMFTNTMSSGASGDKGVVTLILLSFWVRTAVIYLGVASGRSKHSPALKDRKVKGTIQAFSRHEGQVHEGRLLSNSLAGNWI